MNILTWFLSVEGIAQILSIVGMILTILSFQMKEHKFILMFQGLGSCAFLFSYLLLGGMTAVYINIVYISRDVVFFFRKEKKWAQSKLWLAFFLVFAIVMGAISYKAPTDLLPIFGALFSTVALYMTHENTLRLFNLAASPCWLVYNLLAHSIGATLCEIFNLVSIAIALFRFRKDGIFPKKANQSK